MIKSIIIFCIVLFCSPIRLFPQIENFKHVSAFYEELTESFPIVINENKILVFFVNTLKDSIFSVETNDNGNNWSERKFICITGINFTESLIHLTGIKTNSGRILMTWSINSIHIVKSDDEGITWSSPEILASGNIRSLNLTQLTENQTILTYSINLFIASYFLSTNNGNDWNFSGTLKNPSGLNIRSTDFSYVSDNSNGVFGVSLIGNRIFGLFTTIQNLELPDTSLILETSKSISRLKLVKTNDSRLWILFQLYDNTNITTYRQYDVYYMFSDNSGYSWSEPARFTNYLGDDLYHSTAELNNFPLITFSSKRFSNKNQITLSQIGYSEDSEHPPYIINTFIGQADPEMETYNVRSLIIHDTQALDVDAFLLGDFYLGKLFDDGQHNDDEANDYIFANDFNISEIPEYNRSYLLGINKIKLPLLSDGIIANYDPYIEVPLILNISYWNEKFIEVFYELKFHAGSSFAGGTFDDNTFLFSGGFMMGGLDEDKQWANGVASSSIVLDYFPGPVGASKDDLRNRIYLVRADAPPFGHSWQNWRDAVALGADFYDGDGDGIFNPVDKNLNGTWDPDEDMPLIIGDETIWYIYNDAVPANKRRWQSNPKQIEIAQTLFASNKTGFENIIFIRYKIENKSVNILDSVYFGFWADADLGDPSDDVVGCDTQLNSGFTYNNGADYVYGVNPPAFFTTLLQGPVVNSNNTSDTAYVKLGQQIGVKAIPLAKNMDITSHIMFVSGDPDLNDPSKINDVINYLNGLTRTGILLDPCSSPYGEVLGGINCNEINPKLMFSGDPVQQKGWLSKSRGDMRNLLSTGPFILEPNKPIDLISAYVVGRGTDHFNSMTVTREYVKNAIEEYNNNFSSLAYIPPPETNPVTSYNIYQNYPNPFNPVTTIRFEMPDDGFVTLKVYDILGREVKILLNEFRSGNRYEVQFDASYIASGVYFYTISVNNFIETKKMVLIR